MNDRTMSLRYGLNPHQFPARVHPVKQSLPFKVINGLPSYINLLDALTSWQLAAELKRYLGRPAAASFKHVNPVGAAICIPLKEELLQAYFIKDKELSHLANAYVRARGADMLSSYGDCAAFSDPVDLSTAYLLKRHVSDVVVAPGYEKGVIPILKAKKKGKYLIVQVDPSFELPIIEKRETFGVLFEQKRNDINLGPEICSNIVTKNQELSTKAKRDLLLACTVLKYTLSNSVCFAYDGQAIGVGAGQQSRIHCTRLAASKADNWYLRQHPEVLGLRFRPQISLTKRINAIDKYLQDELTTREQRSLEHVLEETPPQLSKEEKRRWLNSLHDVAFASDGLIPFRDNIDRAQQSGVKYIWQAGGSIHDAEIIESANEYGMVMIFSGIRLFLH